MVYSLGQKDQPPVCTIFPQKISMKGIICELDFKGKIRIHQVGKWVRAEQMQKHYGTGMFSACIKMSHEVHRLFYVRSGHLPVCVGLFLKCYNQGYILNS